MQLLEHNQLCPSLSQVADAFCQSEQIVLGVSGVVLLQKSYLQFSHMLGNCMVQQWMDPCCLIIT